MKMQYKTNKKIIIDQRKLDLLFRLNCPDDRIIELLKTGTFKETGDTLIDDTLYCLIDKKEFENWGGKRDGAGRKQKNQDENQLDNHLENQDACQVVDKDRDIDKDIVNSYNSKSKLFISNKFNVNNVPALKIYVDEMPEDVIKSVEQWLIKTKSGQFVDIPFITKQFMNFARRQGRPFFKEEVK